MGIHGIGLADDVVVSGGDLGDVVANILHLVLARTEGIFAGYSAGANLAGAIQLLGGLEQGGTIAIVMCDSGLKYLSTDLWD